jgi:hypothetical protein
METEASAWTAGYRRWALMARNIGLALLLAALIGFAADSFFGAETGFIAYFIALQLVYPGVGLTFGGLAFLTQRRWLRWPLAVLGVLFLLVAVTSLLPYLTPGY